MTGRRPTDAEVRGDTAWTADAIRERLAEITVRASGRGEGGTLALDEARVVVDALVASDDAPEWQGVRDVGEARAILRTLVAEVRRREARRVPRAAVVDEREVRTAVREAAGIVADFSTGSSVAEVADCASDVLAETTAILDPVDAAEVEAAVVREVLAAAGLSSAASDATDLDQATLDRIARGGRV